MINKNIETVKSPQENNYIDLWDMNIGECKAYFYDVCFYEEKGHICECPSEYGCHYRED